MEATAAFDDGFCDDAGAGTAFEDVGGAGEERGEGFDGLAEEGIVAVGGVVFHAEIGVVGWGGELGLHRGGGDSGGFHVLDFFLD